MNGQLKTILVTMICLLMLPAPAIAQPCGGYEVTAIIQAPECPPFGIPPTLGTALSEPINGGLPNVVGYYQSCTIGPQKAFLWIGNEDIFITLDMPMGSSQSKAQGISADASQIVGFLDIPEDGFSYVAFLLDGEKFIEIPPAGGTFSQAWALNNQTPVEVVGTTVDPTTEYKRAFIWQDEVMTLIEPTFGPRSAATDINDAGVVIGWMGASTGTDSHGLLFDAEIVTDLGLASNTFSTWAEAINSKFQILIRGHFNEAEPTERLSGSFLLEDGVFADLGALPGYDVIAGINMNDQAQIVGIARAVNSSNELDTGFIWQDGVMRNLNDLIPPDTGLWIRRATAINQAGQITAWGSSQTGTATMLLTPLDPPEGDLSGDCIVSTIDLLLLLSDWGPCSKCDDCPADFNNDCIVSVADLLILFANWSS